MLCPYCAHPETKVMDKRDSGSLTRRRRECLKCGKRFSTHEKVEWDELKVIKKDFDNNENNFGFEKRIESKGSMGALTSAVLQVDRYFTVHERDPFKYDIYGNPIKWINEEVKVSDDMGKVIFIQPNIKKPDF